MVEVCTPVSYDGIVLAFQPKSMAILVDERAVSGPRERIRVKFPDGAMVRISRCRQMGAKIAVLECPLTDKQRLDLKEVDIFEGDLQEFQEVHTYSDCSRDRVLTPGNITFIFAGGFKHTCSAHQRSTFGSAVFNADAQLVGVCYEYAGKLQAYDIGALMQKIQDTCNIGPMSVNDTIKYLRQ